MQIDSVPLLTSPSPRPDGQIPHPRNRFQSGLQLALGVGGGGDLPEIRIGYVVVRLREHRRIEKVKRLDSKLQLYGFVNGERPKYGEIQVSVPIGAEAISSHVSEGIRRRKREGRTLIGLSGVVLA